MDKTAVFPCLVKAPVTNTAHKLGEPAPPYMKRTMQDVNHLKHQLEDLKKESIRKEDLRHMEDKIAKIIQRVSKVDNSPTRSKRIKNIKNNQKTIVDKLNASDDSKKDNDEANSATKKELKESSSKKCVKKSEKNQFGRNDKNSNRMFKKLEQSFAVNLCLCSGQEGPTNAAQATQRNNDLKHSWKHKNSRNLTTNVSSVKQTKPIKIIATKDNDHEGSKFFTKTLCPSDCICFHKIPSNTSIDKLLETLSKWNGSLNDIDEDKNTFRNSSNNKSLVSDLLSLEKNNKTEIEDSSKSIERIIVKEDVNKEKAYIHILPPTTESEYIGAINLDKSNYNVMQANSLNCINADSRECKNSILRSLPQEVELFEHTPCNIKRQSEIYSIVVKNPQFKCNETETDSSGEKKTKNTEEISENMLIHDLVRKSQLFPNHCDYFVKFLGVTLTNASSSSKTNQDDNILKISSKKPHDVGESMPKTVSLNVNKKENKSSEFLSLDNCDNAGLNFNCLELKKASSRVLDINEDVCVCCNNKEISKDLELNTFNLLEEHMKSKLGEFLHSSCRSSCIQLEEENQLYSAIMKKVKNIISESTTGLSCKCCKEFAKDGSWSRAYGMLQEYLRVKIKRVQCSCVSKEGNTESVFPSILRKVCDLIESDFQKLKEKCKCENNQKPDTDNLNKIILSKNNICNQKMLKKPLNEDECNKKSDDNVLIHQLETHNLIDKSCEVLENVLTNLSTSEKKVSCEFKIYSTDCSCQHTLTESSSLVNYLTVNQCAELILEKQNNDVPCIISTSDIKNAISSSPLKRVTPTNGKEYFGSKPELEQKIPYIGCTLSSKSLMQIDTNQINNIWNSLTDQTCPIKCSYIMNKVQANTIIESEKNIFNNRKSYASNVHVNNERKDISDIEVNTFNDGEDIALKYSNDNCITNNNIIYDETGAGWNNANNDNSSSMHECGLPLNYGNNQLGAFDKKNLYESLNLPTAANNFVKSVASENLTDIDDRSNSEDEKCDCKMVPLCHVKMLVNNIEKKLIQAKCTCDSLNSQVCPVHA